MGPQIYVVVFFIFYFIFFFWGGGQWNALPRQIYICHQPIVPSSGTCKSRMCTDWKVSEFDKGPVTDEPKHFPSHLSLLHLEGLEGFYHMPGKK